MHLRNTEKEIIRKVFAENEQHELNDKTHSIDDTIISTGLFINTVARSFLIISLSYFKTPKKCINFFELFFFEDSYFFPI